MRLVFLEQYLHVLSLHQLMEECTIAISTECPQQSTVDLLSSVTGNQEQNNEQEYETGQAS